MIDPADAGEGTGYELRPITRAALVRARLEEILAEEDDAELATRLEVSDAGLATLARNAVREYRNDYRSLDLEEAIEALATRLEVVS
jgi:hypothetical protein